MDSIAKSPPSNEVTVVVHTDAPIPNTYEGIDIDIARFFDLDVLDMTNDDKRKVSDIQSWLDGTTGDKLLALRDIRLRLGQGMESAVNQTWNWLRINTHIRELRKRQAGLER